MHYDRLQLSDQSTSISFTYENGDFVITFFQDCRCVASGSATGDLLCAAARAAARALGIQEDFGFLPTETGGILRIGDSRQEITGDNDKELVMKIAAGILAHSQNSRQLVHS